MAEDKVVPLEEQAKELMVMEQEAQQLLKSAKQAEDKVKLFWAAFQNEMEARDVKQVKGDFGTITLVEKTSFVADIDQLPSKFIKKAPDVKKIGAAFKLEGKLPKGVTTKQSKYLLKRIK